MADQPVQHVVRVLPDRLGHDQLATGIDPGEDLHPFFLRADEAMFLVLLVRMGAHQPVAACLDRPGQGRFHFLLGGPAFLIRGQAQVAAGDQQFGGE
jgi:hypothetical protein